MEQIEPENKNGVIRLYQIGENIMANYNADTCPNCQNWAGQYETVICKLTESVNQLKSTVEGLAATSVQQNTIIMEAIATQKVLLEQLLEKNEEKSVVNVNNIFPIQSVDELEEINNLINDENREVYINCMSILLRGNKMHKSLLEVFSVDLIVASNIDGICGKLALKNFKNVFHALMDAIRANGEQYPELAVRNALRQVKKRHFQTICVNKKKDTKIRNTKKPNTSDDDEENDVEDDDVEEDDVDEKATLREALAKQKLLMEKLLGKETKEANVRKKFPIQTVEDLEDTNNLITEANRGVYIRYMSKLLKGKLHKTLTDIFSVDLIIASNIDGIHGKLALKTFKTLFEALMDAIRANGEDNPKNAIRTALKVIKKRHFQAICVNKKKETKANGDLQSFEELLFD